jgi:hypothetical protein
MSWILHDATRRAVIASFATREEAEEWRDRNGLGDLFCASPDRASVAADASPGRCATERHRPRRPLGRPEPRRLSCR